MDNYEICKFGNIKYVLQFPDGYVEGEKYPVLLFLHGAGTRGDNIEQVLVNPFFKIINKHAEFPFIVVAPQCNADTWFDIFTNLIDFTRNIAGSSYADTERIYGIGASMGGYALWQLTMSLPDVFAGIVPICGGGMYWNAARLKNTPVWAFHGDDDTVVLAEESKKMVEKVNASGGKAKLTVYENTAHDAWTATYSNYKVFKWLLKNKKESSREIDSEMNDSKIYG